MHRFLLFFTAIICVQLSACTSQHFSKNVDILPFDRVEATASGDIEDALLIRGIGQEWVGHLECYADGSRVLFGETVGSFGGSVDILAAKISPDRKLHWARTIGGRNMERLHEVHPTSDGGFLLVSASDSLFHTPLPGRRDQRPLVIKLSATGKVEWAVSIEQEGDNLFGQLVDVVESGDGSYILVGQARRNVGPGSYRWDMAALKLNANGKSVWGRRYDVGVDSTATGVVLAEENEIVLIGHTLKDDNTSEKPNNDAIILGVDQNGVPIRGYTLTSEGRGLQPFSIIASAGRLTMSGIANRRGGYDIMSMAINPEGVLQWAKTYKHGLGEVSAAIAMTETTGGTYAFAGWYGGKRVQSATGPYSRGLYSVVLVISLQGELAVATTFGGDKDDEARFVGSARDGRLCVALNTEIINPPNSDVLTFLWKPPSRNNVGDFQEAPMIAFTRPLIPNDSDVVYRSESLAADLLVVRELESVKAPSSE